MRVQKKFFFRESLSVNINRRLGTDLGLEDFILKYYNLLIKASLSTPTADMEW
jgi:hypothetical protein